MSINPDGSVTVISHVDQFIDAVDTEAAEGFIAVGDIDTVAIRSRLATMLDQVPNLALFGSGDRYIVYSRKRASKVAVEGGVLSGVQTNVLVPLINALVDEQVVQIDLQVAGSPTNLVAAKAAGLALMTAWTDNMGAGPMGKNVVTSNAGRHVEDETQAEDDGGLDVDPDAQTYLDSQITELASIYGNLLLAKYATPQVPATIDTWVAGLKLKWQQVLGLFGGFLIGPDTGDYPVFSKSASQ
jgi:hypothetical protein